jgi:drug/metabolite transporter (DMT)-like permease
VVLGAVFLGERFVRIEYVGMAAILVAVFLVTSSKLQTGAATVVDEDVTAGGTA